MVDKSVFNIDLQLFAEGDDIIADLTNMGGFTATPAPDPEPASATPDPATVTEDDLTHDDPSNPPDPAPVVENKQEHAFAQMRLQNKQLSETLTALAKQAGVSETDPIKIKEALEAKLLADKTADLVKNQQLPEEIAKEFLQNQDLVKKLLAQQTEQEAYRGLGNIGQKYGLSQQELETFVAQMWNEGIDITKTPGLNIEFEYFSRNAELITQRKVDAAVKAEQERAALAAKGATPPGQQSNPNTQPPGTIGSIQALNNFLEGYKSN